MVQPTAPSVEYSCSFDCLPCTYVCSAISTLVEKITSFVLSIFTAIANAVKSCLGMSPATTPSSPVVTANPVPEDFNFLKARLDGCIEDLQCSYLENHMKTEGDAQEFLAHLLVHDLVLMPQRARGVLPAMINLPVTAYLGSTSPGFVSQIDALRTQFANFEKDLKEEILDHFDEAHLTEDVPDTNALLAPDVFDSTNPTSKESVFYASLNALAKKFVRENPAFTACANAVRAKYLSDQIDSD